LTVLEVKGASKHFGGVKAVENISLKVEEHSITALIGPNGAGKTTLFNLLTAVYSPTAGKILFNGSNMAGLKAHEIVGRGIARTFQNIRLFDNLTVLDNVRIGLHGKLPLNPFLPWMFRAKRKVEADAVAAARKYLEFVDLSDAEDELASNLPYGKQRTLEIARALATGPKLLLLDEPAAGMNHTETGELIALIRKIRDTGITVMLIEHDMKLVMNISEHIYVLDHGELLEEGDSQQIQNSDKVRAAYLGEDDDHE